MIVTPNGKAAEVNATLVGAVLKVPELMAIFAVVAISCATIKYWITPAVTEAPP